MYGDTRKYMTGIFSGQTPIRRTNPKMGESEYYYFKPNQNGWSSLSEVETVDVPTKDTPNPFLQPQTNTFGQPMQLAQNSISTDEIYNDYPTLRDDKRDFFKSTVESIVKTIPSSFESNNPLTQSLGAARDLGENYINMVNANLKSSEDMETKGTTTDNYYHCLGNYNAASRGYYGTRTAEVIGDVREIADWGMNKLFKNKSFSQSNADFKNDRNVNLDSRNMAKSGRYNSAWEACEKYRPSHYNPDERLYYYRKY